MTDTESFFDSLVTDAANRRRTPAECLSVCQRSHPELVEALRLALALRFVTPDAAEFNTARRNIRYALDAMLDEEDVAYAPTVRSLSQPARARNSRWRLVALCAAILTVIFMGNWMLTSAAADALPGSPLYSYKRTEEDIELRMAWSSQLRSEVLAQVAIHRLAEARAEAAQHNIGQALKLMKECDKTASQLVDIVVTMHRQHEDDDSVKRALAQTLQAEYDTLAQARTHGQATLAQVLAKSVTEQQHMLTASNIVVPPLATPIPTLLPVATQPAATAQPTGAGNGAPTPDPKTTPAATPQPHSTPPPKPTPGGHGNGGDNTDMNGNGKSG
ncbi:MAG TPA: DUF5667 domain-containing protein [Ktedonobacterales bacterium]|nr:DUF5667 domain-containing protein [Ktedonobacterales bacterium]